MYKTKPRVIEQIKALVRDGRSIREIQALSGAAKATIAKYRDECEPIECLCGKPAKHSGFCWVRIERSQGRQAYLRRFHGERIKAPYGVDETYYGRDQ